MHACVCLAFLQNIPSVPKQITETSRKSDVSLFLKNKVLPVLTAMLTLLLVCEAGEDCVSIETRSPCSPGCGVFAAGPEEPA